MLTYANFQEKSVVFNQSDFNFMYKFDFEPIELNALTCLKYP